MLILSVTSKCGPKICFMYKFLFYLDEIVVIFISSENILSNYIKKCIIQFKYTNYQYELCLNFT